MQLGTMGRTYSDIQGPTATVTVLPYPEIYGCCEMEVSVVVSTKYGRCVHNGTRAAGRAT